MTDYTDPSTIDVDEVIANINHAYKMRGHRWDKTVSWPNVTVKALADEIGELRHENERLRAVLSGFLDWTAAYKAGCPCGNCQGRTLLGDYGHESGANSGKQEGADDV